MSSERKPKLAFLFAGKLNKIRTFALLLIFLGMLVMYIGFLFPSLMQLFFILGMLWVLASVGIYFWTGMLSLQSLKVNCPVCGKHTKVLGRRDECMHCRSILSVDPSDAPNASKEKTKGNVPETNEANQSSKESIHPDQTEPDQEEKSVK
ncbi:DUF2614 family zinc ribbon-containing protein [Thermoflavimicrobium dichotomicum]|uniref:Zinc-ribbon containing domain-containing protein n=1 Tax=Thermoflavimicrobium dichotomicum TaxID=46223 RepID=A0A1I3JB25_9BACL|nr:DUF2614 family zinc ribbon-containing protein [Thermoflavimicrobium dichotomicum]SFI57326.1 Zinc-ribbon containing domain-containing protein [Thermoflavimicrobium dichotomicum]